MKETSQEKSRLTPRRVYSCRTSVKDVIAPHKTHSCLREEPRPADLEQTPEGPTGH